MLLCVCMVYNAFSSDMCYLLLYILRQGVVLLTFWPCYLPSCQLIYLILFLFMTNEMIYLILLFYIIIYYLILIVSPPTRHDTYILNHVNSSFIFTFVFLTFMLPFCFRQHLIEVLVFPYWFEGFPVSSSYVCLSISCQRFRR